MECKGLIFRGKKTSYLHNDKYVRQESMSLLKRKSCKGCEKCGWMLEHLNEFLGNSIDPIISEIEDGNLYKLRTINEGRDWETGYIDEYDFEFMAFEEIKDG